MEPIAGLSFPEVPGIPESLNGEVEISTGGTD